MYLDMWQSIWGFAGKAPRYNQIRLFRFETCGQIEGGDAMRVAIFLLGMCAIFSASAAAQGPVGVGGGIPSGPRYTAAIEHQDYPWQFAVGYQYNRDNLIGSPFNTHGGNFSLARSFGRWLGAEIQIGAGFMGKTGQTTTPPNLDSKSVYVGAGPRLTYRNRSRYEPWVHLTVGLEHFRFSQTAGVLGTNNGLAGNAGGGVDVYLRPHVSLRTEADVLGSRFFSTNQRSFQVVGGLVFGF
jgi:Outer membrane protein beta-barrel domain